ncbi:endolytic transglycosylase MltG [Thermoproteota archaeon]
MFSIKTSRSVYVKIGILMFSAAFLLWLGYELFIPASSENYKLLIKIPKGTSVSAASNILTKNNLIKHPASLIILAKLLGKEHKIHAGEYWVSPSDSLLTILKTLEGKNGTALVKITIPEGLRLTQIADTLENKGLINKETFVDFINHQAKPMLSQKYHFLQQIPTRNIEGYLFPETYYFSKNTTPEKIADAFLTQFEKQIIPIWNKAVQENDPNTKRYTLHQLLTLASLIQKEAKIVSEMPLISSVFYNRLQKRMYLACDPTIVYAMGLTYKDVVHYKDLDIDSPYNTYRNFGLPPTPIGAPGIQAFSAALRPENTQYLFFVANKAGEHNFSYTYEQHLDIQKKLR